MLGLTMLLEVIKSQVMFCEMILDEVRLVTSIVLLVSVSEVTLDELRLDEVICLRMLI